VSVEATELKTNYEHFMTLFGLTQDPSDVNTCNQAYDYPVSNRKVFWDADPYRANSCFLVTYETPFERYIANDYKTCVDHFIL